jgi:hypothetical protein
MTRINIKTVLGINGMKELFSGLKVYYPQNVWHVRETRRGA